MECPVYKEYGILYQFNELSAGERMLYEAHLKSCSYCQSEITENRMIIEQIEELPQVQPKAKITHEILAASQKQPRKSSTWSKLNFVPTFIQPPFRWTWAVSVAAIVVIVGFVTMHPFSRIPETFEWEDDFYTQTAGIEESLDVLGGSETLSNSGYETGLSIDQDDINGIYDQIQLIDDAFNRI